MGAPLWIALASLLPLTWGLCPVSILPEARQDCHPWPGVTEESCGEIWGCDWCESSTPGVPWCLKNPEMCPSTVPFNERIDCPSGIDRGSCADAGCVWCPVFETGIPWCFQDPEVTTGGETCPTEEFFIADEERIDCMPEVESDAEACTQRGCYWCPTGWAGAPYCMAPKTMGYLMEGDPEETELGWRINLQRRNYPTWYGRDIVQLVMDVEFQTEDRLRVKIYDPSAQRYEVPINIPSPSTKPDTQQYEILFTNDPAFNFRVIRKSSGLVLFDTSIGGLQFSDQFLQIAAYLPTSNVYGFGETEHRQFRHDMNYRSWGMYARDQPTGEFNCYGVHPYFQALDENNEMFGVLFLNSNAQEVTMLPAPGLVYKTTGGILDLYFFLGPEPEQVTQQYTEAIGRPVMPPYWALGFHLSRYGYDTLEKMNETLFRNRDAGVPVDVIHGDIDYMQDFIIFTYSQDRFAGLPQYIRDLKEYGVHFITILDPFLPNDQPWYEPYQRGDAVGAFIKDQDGIENSVGEAWPPGTCVFADYTSPAARTWWTDECVLFHDTLEFDGLWIDMNEPASFVAGSIEGCEYNRYNNPLYKPAAVLGNVIFDKTVCSDHIQYAGLHHDYHSLYGYSMSPASLDATRAANPGKRSYVFGRSTYPGAGKYVGHWLGDNWSEWPNVAYSIIGMLEFNYFGIPYVGSDICGFLHDAEEEMCERWQQLGAFYGFSRNHNGYGWIEQDPAVWESGDVAETSIFTLNIRYTLLPYLYTLYHNAHTYGNTVIRALLNEFPNDEECHSIDRQFLWGSSFLISPVLESQTFSIQAYFPDQRWYSYHDGVEVAARGEYTTLDAPWWFINLHVRGGSVLPTQEPALATDFSRLNPMGLIVALDDADQATGELFWDDGVSLDTFENDNYLHLSFSVDAGTLTGSITHDGYNDGLSFSTVRVFGVSGAVTAVTVNGETHETWQQGDELLITELSLPINSPFTVSWA